MKIINKIKSRLIKLRVATRKETSAEKEARANLLNEIIKIDNQKIEATDAWNKYRQRLRIYILNNDPRNFLRWDPIVGSMFYGGNKSELDYLKDHNWNVWSPVINETFVGNPPRFKYHKKSSGNLIHNAYNLSRVSNRFNVDIAKLSNIVEYGAGYGCMAKLINDIGFKGAYEIFDIPEFLALQKYYLHLTNTHGDFRFKDQIEKIESVNPDLFIAMWSLSESPIEYRAKFLETIGKPKYVLIGYQQKFETIDNIKYFKEYQESNPDYEWYDGEIDHLPKNYYLVGKKK